MPLAWRLEIKGTLPLTFSARDIQGQHEAIGLGLLHRAAVALDLAADAQSSINHLQGGKLSRPGSEQANQGHSEPELVVLVLLQMIEQGRKLLGFDRGCQVVSTHTGICRSDQLLQLLTLQGHPTGRRPRPGHRKTQESSDVTEVALAALPSRGASLEMLLGIGTHQAATVLRPWPCFKRLERQPHTPMQVHEGRGASVLPRLKKGRGDRGPIDGIVITRRAPVCKQGMSLRQAQLLVFHPFLQHRHGAEHGRSTTGSPMDIEGHTAGRAIRKPTGELDLPGLLSNRSTPPVLKLDLVAQGPDPGGREAGVDTWHGARRKEGSGSAPGRR